MPLRIPAVLAFTVVGTAAAAGLASCGGGSPPPPDAMACLVRCVPTGVGSNSCTPPTCATGPNHDVCPMGCTTEPIA